MATLVLSLNCHEPFRSRPISFQSRNPYVSSLKFNTNQHNTLSFCTPLKTLARFSPIVHALEKDSNSDTVQDGEVNNLGVRAALSMLRFYKREISPILPKSCRYIPTCSEYSMEAYKRYGVVKGTILTAWRLCRCNPLGGSGYDPPRWFDEVRQPEEVDD